MSQNSSLSLSDLIDEVCEFNVVNESIKPGGNDLSDKNPLPVEKDKSLKGGYKKTLNDEIDSVMNNEEDEEDDTEDEECDECDDEPKKKEWKRPWEDDDNEEDEETVQESVKVLKKTLNKGMAKKSIFDTLYKKCLNENFGQDMGEDDDLGALGLDDASTDDDLDDDFHSEEDDGVTFTLDRATAQALMSVLQGALGDDEDDSGEFEDETEDEFENEDDGMDFEEDEEVQGTKVAADKKAAFQGKSNKVSSKVTAKKAKAKTDVTDEVGIKDGALPITALQGKGNQVPGSTLKQKATYFK
jgi:hypothetical protein